MTSDQRCRHRTGVGPTLQTTHPAQPSSLTAVAARHPPEKVVKPNSKCALFSIPVNIMRLMNKTHSNVISVLGSWRVSGQELWPELVDVEGEEERSASLLGCSDSWCSVVASIVRAGHTLQHTSDSAPLSVQLSSVGRLSECSPGGRWKMKDCLHIIWICDDKQF